jgi:hypothetical protein
VCRSLLPPNAISNRRRTRGISPLGDVNGWRGIARHCGREGNLFRRQLMINFSCQANFAAALCALDAVRAIV